MSKPRLIPTITMIATIVAVSLSGCGSRKQSASAKPSSATPARVSSSIPEGVELTRPERWEAHVSGVHPSDVISVRFLIDGKVRHIERQPPYVFDGDDNELHPGTLKPGTHTFAIDADVRGGKRLTTASTAIVTRAAPGFPASVVGRWTRHVTAADTVRTASVRRPEDGEALPGGTWTVQVGADGVARYTDPTGQSNNQTVGQVNFEPGGRLLVGDLIPNVPDTEGYFCHDPHPAGVYRWSITAGALVIRVVRDHACADRNSFWTGRFTR